jgi:hypothetical protein
MHKHGVAFLAGSAAKFKGQTDFGCHGNPPCRTDILSRQFGVGPRNFLGLPKQYFDALPRDLLNATLLHHKLTMQKCAVRLHNTCA